MLTIFLQIQYSFLSRIDRGRISQQAREVLGRATAPSNAKNSALSLSVFY